MSTNYSDACLQELPLHMDTLGFQLSLNGQPVILPHLIYSILSLSVLLKAMASQLSFSRELEDEAFLAVTEK